MKAIYTLFYITILSACLLSCSKKEQAKPAATGSSQKTDSSNPPVTYSTDTFVGTYLEIDYGNYPILNQTEAITDSPFIFYVVYPDANTVIFMNGSPINYHGGQLFIRDTFAVNQNGTYQAVINPARNYGIDNYQNSGDYFAFTTTQKLTFTWSCLVPAGCVDVQLDSCTFTGIKTTR